MRLLLSWVRDFVDIKAPAKDIADTLALRGFEVASIEHLGDDDAVIDFEVTANRPDCLSVLGFAREIATTYRLPLRTPAAGAGEPGALASVPDTGSDRLQVLIEDEVRCPRFAAAVADVSRVDSPAWMTSRLVASGVRPISALVDITNYVLMELGHPMHAYDLETLEGRTLRARGARQGERLVTLDGTPRTLDAEMLVIGDNAGAQGIAGVMGGAASEVSATTQAVALEAAYFQPASIRRTSRRLGLKTEASARFERGADINAPVMAIRRALALMQQLGAGVPSGGIIDVYPAPRTARRIALRRRALDNLLGLAVPDDEVERILMSLGLDVMRTPDGWQTEVPTFRVDLLREVDLIEEVGRHHGFDKLEAAFPAMTAAAAAQDARVPRDHYVRRALTAAGLNEAVTFGFIEAETARGYVAAEDGAADLVAVANPLSALFDTLRPSLLPGLVAAVAHNRRHGRRDVGLFELGARFSKGEGETRGVAIAWTGAAQAEHWSVPPRDVDFFDIKGVVEQLARVLHAPLTWEPVSDVPYLVPGQAARASVNGLHVGTAGVLLPVLADKAGAPRQDRIVVAELHLDRLASLGKQRPVSVQPLLRFPFVVRDISIVVSDALPATIIRDTIRSAASGQPAPLTTVAFFDRYQGKGVAERSVSLSIRLTFQSTERTLTDVEVQRTFEHILSALVQEHGAVQR